MCLEAVIVRWGLLLCLRVCIGLVNVCLGSCEFRVLPVFARDAGRLVLRAPHTRGSAQGQVATGFWGYLDQEFRFSVIECWGSAHRAFHKSDQGGLQTSSYDIFIVPGGYAPNFAESRLSAAKRGALSPQPSKLYTGLSLKTGSLPVATPIVKRSP